MKCGRPRAALFAAVALSAFVHACAPAGQQAPDAGAPAEQKNGGSGPKYGGTLVLLMNQAGDPPSFDMHQESTSATTGAAGPFYDNLIRFDPLQPDQIAPDLAEGWELSPDGKTYTFTLHTGVQFHNGNPFTSADVKFTLDRVIDPPEGIRSPRRTAFSPVTSVETPDDHTVVIKVERPYPSLLAQLAQGWMAVFDKEWIDANGHDVPEQEMMGTGPFKLDHYTRGTEIVRVKNENYWNEGLPYLDGIKHLIVPDPTTRIAALRTGQVHLLNLNFLDFGTFQTDMPNEMDFTRYGSLGFGSLYMNTTRKPFDDPRVREALNLVINRHDAIDILNQGDGFLGGYMRPGGPWSLSAEEILKFPGYGKDKTRDIDRARQLLAEAGFPNGFDVEIKTRQSQGYIDLSIFVIDQLKQIGINAKVTPRETAQAYDLAYKGDFDLLTWSHGFALDDPDAVYNEFYLCNAPRNWSRLCTDSVDQLFMKQSQETDPVKRKQSVMELERTAVPTASKIITSWGMSRNATWKFVKNYVPHPSGYNNIRYDMVWLDQ